MEEEGGFGVYGEKTRYATLQKQKHDVVPNNRGYETLRHFRSNIPSLVRGSFDIPNIFTFELLNMTIHCVVNYI
jgi:hypothetical protein